MFPVAWGRWVFEASSPNVHFLVLRCSWDLLGLLFWRSRCFHAPQPLRMYPIIARPQHKPGWPLLRWCNCCYRWLASLFCVAVHAGPAVETGNNQRSYFVCLKSLFYASIRWRSVTEHKPRLYLWSGLMRITLYHHIICNKRISCTLMFHPAFWNLYLETKHELCSARHGSTENVWLDWSFNVLSSVSGSTHQFLLGPQMFRCDDVRNF